MKMLNGKELIDFVSSTGFTPEYAWSTGFLDLGSTDSTPQLGSIKSVYDERSDDGGWEEVIYLEYFDVYLRTWVNEYAEYFDDWEIVVPGTKVVYSTYSGEEKYPSPPGQQKDITPNFYRGQDL